MLWRQPRHIATARVCSTRQPHVRAPQDRRGPLHRGSSRREQGPAPAPTSRQKERVFASSWRCANPRPAARGPRSPKQTAPASRSRKAMTVQTRERRDLSEDESLHGPSRPPPIPRRGQRCAWRRRSLRARLAELPNSGELLLSPPPQAIVRRIARRRQMQPTRQSVTGRISCCDSLNITHSVQFKFSYGAVTSSRKNCLLVEDMGISGRTLKKFGVFVIVTQLVPQFVKSPLNWAEHEASASG